MLHGLVASYFLHIRCHRIVHLLEPKLTPIGTRYWLVFRWIVLVRATRQDAAFLVEVEAKKEGHRIPIGGRSVVDAMDGGFEPVIRKPHQVVSNIYHHGILDR